MPTLMETISRASEPYALKSIKLQKSRSELNLPDSNKGSNIFCSAEIALDNLTLIAGSPACFDGPIVIDANVDRIRKMGRAYLPPVVVLSGLNKLKEIKASGEDAHAKVWIGTQGLKKLSISAGDALGNSELSSKLQKAISSKYAKKPNVNGYDYMKTPWIAEIYPYDNYFVFSLEGDNFKQAFTFDSKARTVTLDGDKVAVHSEYIPNVSAAFGPATMTYNPECDLITSYGGVNSELNSPKVMSNVEEALSAYHAQIKAMQYRPSLSASQKVPTLLAMAAHEANIANRVEQVKDFSAPDFVKWQVETMLAAAEDQVKYYNRKMLFASDYAYVGDEGDISTWLLPMHSPKAASVSLLAMASEPAIPKDERVEVKARLELAAGGPGSGRKKSVRIQFTDKSKMSHGQLVEFEKSHGFSHKQAVERATNRQQNGGSLSEDFLKEKVRQRGMRMADRNAFKKKQMAPVRSRMS